MPILISSLSLSTGAHLGFSRGGADFQKKIENFVDLIFRSTKLIVSSSAKTLKSPRFRFGKIFCAAGNFLKKQAIKGVLALFEKILPKNRVFLARAFASKLVHFGNEGAFKKIIGSVNRK